MNNQPVHPALAQVPADELLDARDISCRVKHPLILERANMLAVGSSFVLVNGHAPEPLRYQFDAMFPGCFEWHYLVDEETLAAVRITRRAPNPASAPAMTEAASPGGCGNHAR